MLVLTNVQLSAQALYRVLITNVEGAVTSLVARLYILVPPSLTAGPSNQVADVGDAVIFSASATGPPPLFYEWLFQDRNRPNRTNASFYLKNIQLTNAGAYKVVVTNVNGSATSEVATLMVVPPSFTRTSGTNILLVIADDYGTDGLSLYKTNAGASLPPTPNINSLYNSGVLFRNAYACPTCSPTRSCLLTGRYGFRTGIGLYINGPPPYDTRQDSLPGVASLAGWDCLPIESFRAVLALAAPAPRLFMAREVTSLTLPPPAERSETRYLASYGFSDTL